MASFCQGGRLGQGRASERGSSGGRPEFLADPIALPALLGASSWRWPLWFVFLSRRGSARFALATAGAPVAQRPVDLA